MFYVKLLFFLRNGVRIERCTEEFVQMDNHLSARPAAQSVEELFRNLASVFLNGVCPGGIMHRHGIGEGAIAVKNISGIPSFGWRKQRHKKPEDTCTSSNRAQPDRKPAIGNFY